MLNEPSGDSEHGSKFSLGVAFGGEDDDGVALVLVEFGASVVSGSCNVYLIAEVGH